jgi:cytochrome b6-f complex iron-sulfur subunit
MAQHDHPDACAGCGTRTETVSSNGIGRRTFLAQSAVLAAIAALNACAGGDGGGLTAPDLGGSSGSAGATIKVSDQPALATVGGTALVTIASSPFAIVRTGSNTFVALSRVCPHQGSIVNKTTNGFLCPNHGAQFSSTGTWVGGERTSSLRSYATSYDAATDALTIG